MLIGFAATPVRVMGAMPTAGKFFYLGAVSDSIAFDPQYGNAMTMIREAGWTGEGMGDEVAKFFDAKWQYENDNELMARAVMVLEGGVLGETIGGFLRLVGPARRAGRAFLDAPTEGMGGPLGDLASGGRTGEMPTIMDQIPARIMDTPLSKEAQDAIRQGAAHYMARTRKILDLVNKEGMTPEQALLEVEKGEFALSRINSTYLKPAMAEALAPMFNTTPEAARELIDTFERGGGDLTRLIMDQSHITQEQALDMLSTGGLGQTRQWTMERHAASALESSNLETKSRKMGRQMAEGLLIDDQKSAIDKYLSETPGLRHLADPADDAAAAERKLIVDRAKSWKREHLRKALVGRPDSLTGAPGYYRGKKYTPEARLDQVELLYNRAKAGLVGRMWYENSSRRVMELVGDNVEDAEKFVQLLAITSPQNPVPNNWNHALQMWHAWKNNDQIAWDGLMNSERRGMNGTMAQRAHDLLYGNQPWNGRKTNNFYVALMREIQPELFTSAGWTAKFGEELPENIAVIDIHMMRTFGYATGNPSQQQFTFAENMLGEIRDRLNREGFEGGEFTTDQIQAMLWEEQRYRTKELPKWQEEVRKAEAAGKPLPPKPEMTTQDFSTVSDMRQAEVRIDYTPSETGVLDGMSDAPLEARGSYSVDMHAATMPDGKDRLADVIGMTQPRTIEPDSLMPGAHISFDIPQTSMNAGTVDPAAMQMVGDYVRGRMLATRASEMSSYREFPAGSGPKAGTRNGFTYPLVGEYSTELRNSLYDAIEARWGENAFAAVEIHQTADGVSLVNLNTQLVPLKEWQDEIHGIISEWHNSGSNPYGLNVPKRKPLGFTASGVRVVHDFGTDPGGVGLINGISESRRDAVVDVVRGEIGPRTQAVNEHYSRQGFGEPGEVRIGEQPVDADVDAARELGHNGTLAQLIDDGRTVQGLARLESGGVTIINATAHADITTGIHELGHALRNQLFAGAGKADAKLQQKLMEAFGVVDGVWTREAEEAFAESWEALVLEGRFDGRSDNAMGILAAYARDLYQEIKNTPAADNMTPAMRDALGRLVDREGLPIQWAPGKFIPAVDWSKVVARAKQVDAEGGDWTTIIEPDDILGTARQKTDLVGSVKREDLSFDLDTDEDMLRYMALIEDVTRSVRNAGVGATRRTDAKTQSEALRLFNSLLGRGEAELPQTMREMMVHDFMDEALDAKVIAMRTGLSVQLKRIVQLAKKAEQTRNVADYARLQRQFMQFQMAQAYVKRVSGETARGLRAWGQKTKVPTWDQITDPAGARQFMEDLGADMAYGQELATHLSKITVPDDARAAIALVSNSLVTPGRRALNMFYEVFINGLLSAPATFVTIAAASPLLVMAGMGGMKALGAAFRRDRRTLMEVFENAQRMYDNAKASWSMAGRALVEEESQLMPGRSLVDVRDQRAIRMEYEDNWLQRGVNHILGKEADDVAGQRVGRAGARTVNATGRIVRAPSNVIQFFDEGFRQMNARTALQARLHRDISDRMWAKHKERFTRPDPMDDMVPPTVREFTEADRRAFVDANKDVISSEVRTQMDTLIRDGHLRTREQIIKEATSGNVLVTEDMAARNPDLVDVVGQPINSIEEPFVRARAIQSYMDMNYNARHAELIGYAEDYATRAVFQGDLGPIGKKVQELVDVMPMGAGRLIFPFVRTPVNILKAWGGTLPTSYLVEGANRILGGVPRAVRARSFKGVWELDPNSVLNELHTGTLDDIMSGDPVRMAQARGRQAGGAMLLIGSYELAYDGFITGGGPRDGDRRRQMMDAGWRPYSIYLPGHGYVSYMRADPYAQSLALMADSIELLEDQNNKGDYQEKLNYLSALVLSVGQQMQEKTFMQGIGDLMAATQDPKAAEKWANRLGTSATVPGSSLQRNIMDIQDPYLREMRTLTDHYRKQTFFGNPEGVAPSRNVLGETREKYTRDSPESEGPLAWANMFNIMRWSSESDDPIYREMARLNVPFTPPSEILQDMQLTMFTRDGYAFTAHDEWMELIGTITIEDTLTGKETTLREELESYISPDGEYHDIYQQMTLVEDDGTPEKAAFIKGIISEYHKEARLRMISRYPEIDFIYNTRKLERRKRDRATMERLGASPETLQDMDAVIEALEEATNR